MDLVMDRTETESPFGGLVEHQLRTALWHAGREHRGGSMLWDVVESIRWTREQAFHPDSDAAFVWDASGDLRLNGRIVPLNGRYLADRFLQAGVRPDPGQFYVLPPTLAIDAITETIGRLDRERIGIERALATLRAWLARGGSDDVTMIREATRLNEASLTAIKSRTIRLIAARATAEELTRPPAQQAARAAA